MSGGTARWLGAEKTQKHDNFYSRMFDAGQKLPSHAGSRSNARQAPCPASTLNGLVGHYLPE